MINHLMLILRNKGYSYFNHLFTRFVLKCELNLPSVDVSSLPQVFDLSHIHCIISS